MIEDLTACFDGLVDPRVTRRCNHRLIDILMIAVSAVIACAESWEDIELYGRSKQAWLKTFLALPNGIPSHDTFRRVFMLIDPDAFEGCFARWARSLTSKVEREVVAIDGKTETEIRYFLTSCNDDPAVLAQAIRRHWSIENSLHWVLDVTFREDDSRVRDRTAARNLALLRKIALNLVAADRSSQTSVRGRRKKAAWNDDYMLRIITRQLHA